MPFHTFILFARIAKLVGRHDELLPNLPNSPKSSNLLQDFVKFAKFLTACISWSWPGSSKVELPSPWVTMWIKIPWTHWFEFDISNHVATNQMWVQTTRQSMSRKQTSFNLMACVLLARLAYCHRLGRVFCCRKYPHPQIKVFFGFTFCPHYSGSSSLASCCLFCRKFGFFETPCSQNF